MMLVWNALLRHLEPVEVAICSNAQPPATAALVAGLAEVYSVALPGAARTAWQEHAVLDLRRQTGILGGPARHPNTHEDTR